MTGFVPSFRGIRGHDRIVSLLGAALGRDRLAHAYLFHGPDGIGKKSTALAFAAALHCQTGKERRDACGSCLACRKIRHGNHPDLSILAPEGAFIKMAAVRDLQERMAFRPLEGGRRITIIDEADSLHPAAANALLKTLEEPAAANILVLVSPRPHLLPATILSRCQRIRFGPLAPEIVAGLLADRGVEEAAARFLSRACGGSLARALEMQGEGFLALRRVLRDRLAKGFPGDPASVFLFLGAFGREREDATAALEILRSFLRDALLFREAGSGINPINEDALDTVRLLAGSRTERELLDGLSAVDRACRALERNANRMLTLEALVFRLSPLCKEDAAGMRR